MTRLSLSSHNVIDYLVAHQLCQSEEKAPENIELIPAKNFNLLVTLPDESKLLVKQERQNSQGKTAEEFVGEWQIKEFVDRFVELSSFKAFMPEWLHFDRDNHILVSRYLEKYQDLSKFYLEEKVFSEAIATSVGKTLGILHRHTYNQADYRAIVAKTFTEIEKHPILGLIRGLEIITPEVFGIVPVDALKFFALYQRYESLGNAIRELGDSLTPVCLVHNDLKLNNILLHQDWQKTEQPLIRLIDWERADWGDPASDLGMLIGSYLQIWLDSLVVSKSLSIEESLRLATVPLENLQPSLEALMLAYLQEFPQVSCDRPDFLQRVVQWTGFALIGQIQSVIQYQKSFGNTGIATLQVAKSLLCRPQASLPTIFGVKEVAGVSREEINKGQMTNDVRINNQ